MLTNPLPDFSSFCATSPSFYLLCACRTKKDCKITGTNTTKNICKATTARATPTCSSSTSPWHGARALSPPTSHFSRAAHSVSTHPPPKTLPLPLPKVVPQRLPRLIVAGIGKSLYRRLSASARGVFIAFPFRNLFQTSFTFARGQGKNSAVLEWSERKTKTCIYCESILVLPQNVPDSGN